ncbi:MAG: alcohol dehydrogenase family protein [Gammaproteobacteria bacterium]|nr:alcohol dehydrogenase family protein [Gammaproteobacteria bacterium]
MNAVVEQITMRGVVLTGHGGLDRLEYREDLPAPQPAKGEVLIEVGACAINNTDLWTREGAYAVDGAGGWQGAPLAFPRVQGCDVAGRIVAVGEEVDEARVGQRVVVDPTLYGPRGDGLVDAGYLGSERDGGFAELVTVPEKNAHAVDSTLSDAELASFPCSYGTAQRMLNRARVITGETVLVTGATGGVGSALVQLANAIGARAIAVVGPGKEKTVRELEPAGVIPRDAPDLAAAVKEVLGDVPLDAVADVVAGERVRELLEALRPEGRYVTAGAIAGPIVTVDWRTLYLKQLEIIGSSLATRRDFSDMLKLVLDGKVRPLVARTYPLSELARAQREFQRKDFLGKLVVLIKPEAAEPPPPAEPEKPEKS